MKAFFTDLLSRNGAMSMLRFMSILSLIIGAGIAIYAIGVKSDLPYVPEIVAIFVGSAFGGKISQKYIESKHEKAD